jgi:hypothetical protein
MPIRIGHWLQGVFNLNGIKRVLHNIQPETKLFIHIAIVAVEAIKKVIDNPLVDVFTEMTKNKIDDAIVAQARIWIPKTLAELKLSDQCAGLTDPSEIVKCAAKVLQQFSGDIKDIKLNELAEAFTLAAADGKLTWNEIAGLVKIVFDHEYKQPV